MSYKSAVLLSALVATGSASAADIPVFEDEIAGNSFRQRWVQPRNSGFQPATFLFELVSGPSDFFIKDVRFPRSADGFSVSQQGDLWVGSGATGTRNIRFDLVFDSVAGTNSSNNQDFAWKITYVNSNGDSFAGFQWRNFNTGGAISFARGGGFFSLNSSEFSQLSTIPLPTSGGMALAGIAGLGLVRRRRSA